MAVDRSCCCCCWEQWLLALVLALGAAEEDLSLPLVYLVSLVSLLSLLYLACPGLSLPYSGLFWSLLVRIVSPIAILIACLLSTIRVEANHPVMG